MIVEKMKWEYAVGLGSGKKVGEELDGVFRGIIK
jgi:hypothetical protein